MKLSFEHNESIDDWTNGLKHKVNNTDGNDLDVWNLATGIVYMLKKFRIWSFSLGSLVLRVWWIVSDFASRFS